MNWFKKKIKNWLLKDEIDEIKILKQTIESEELQEVIAEKKNENEQLWSLIVKKRTEDFHGLTDEQNEKLEEIRNSIPLEAYNAVATTGSYRTLVELYELHQEHGISFENFKINPEYISYLTPDTDLVQMQEEIREADFKKHSNLANKPIFQTELDINKENFKNINKENNEKSDK